MLQVIMSEQIVHEAAARAGRKDYQGAVDYVRAHAAELTDESRVPALLQAFKAAVEGGLSAHARELAIEIDREDPEIPSVKRFLAGQ